MTGEVVFVYGGEPYDVYIGRGKDPNDPQGRHHGTIMTGNPNDWGNPWSHKDGTLAKFKVSTVEEAVANFRDYVEARPNLMAAIRRDLCGKVLACWCNSPRRKNKTHEACHGDVLVEIANSRENA